jgi:phosphatidylserine decarboxylase
VDEIRYIERESGTQKTEQVPGGNMLKFLYGSPLGRLTLSILIKRKIFSAIGGWFMNTKYSAKRVMPFVKQYGINLDEYYVPEKGFKHFNDFFYRKIKPECRVISEQVASPADGKILVFPVLSDIPKFFIKGSEFDLNTFLQNKELSDKYRKGSMAIIRLAPPDYHRFHFPVGGEVGNITKIKGAYYSVSPLALRKNLQIFLENKRELCQVKSDNHGDVLIVDVGATLTGSIIQTFDENSQIAKGQEKGYFAFGGSTTVLFFENKKVQFDPDLVANTLNGFETTIKMGEQIAV